MSTVVKVFINSFPLWNHLMMELGLRGFRLDVGTGLGEGEAHSQICENTQEMPQS